MAKDNFRIDGGHEEVEYGGAEWDAVRKEMGYGDVGGVLTWFYWGSIGYTEYEMVILSSIDSVRSWIICRS